MTAARALLLVLSVLASACADETVQRLRLRFPDCSIDPEIVSTVLFVMEAADGAPIPGLEAGSSEQDGVTVSVLDVDADDTLEVVLRLERAQHDLRDGFAIRLLEDGSFATEITVDALAADHTGRQIGRLDGDLPRFRFEKDEEHTLDLPLVCMCLGMPACGGTCTTPDQSPQCRPPGNSERYCQDGLDNDTDPLRDCADPECYRRGPCAACDVEVCDNGVDDDCDGAIDCGDDACAGRLACEATTPEVCDNGGDDDRDGLRDCLDPDCADNRDCQGECTPRDEVCDNRRDDDCDHRIDCVDDQCARPAAETACADGFDDDCDDRVDCADPDCYGRDGCTCDALVAEERLALPNGCHDGLNNDCDEFFDCEDPDCAGAFDEICDDAVDNDCDGSNNCDDDDCPTDTATEICDDLYDNDCNGKFDCEDGECVQGDRVERACVDFLDNDCDQDLDCDDADCAELPVCTGTS